MNSLEWYKYERQLGTISYKWVGVKEISENLKRSCKDYLETILARYRNVHYRWLNVDKRERDIIPSLNLIPKVYKLSQGANAANEEIVKGRPIVTTNSWCTVEASKYIQRELRDFLETFKQYVLLGSEKDFVTFAEKMK